MQANTLLPKAEEVLENVTLTKHRGQELLNRAEDFFRDIQGIYCNPNLNYTKTKQKPVALMAVGRLSCKQERQREVLLGRSINIMKIEIACWDCVESIRQTGSDKISMMNYFDCAHTFFGVNAICSM